MIQAQRLFAPRAVAKGCLTWVYDTAVSKKPRLPKQKCCVSSSRCKRCPIRMLREGSLPEGYTVKKRKLVATGATATSITKSGKKGKKGKREKAQPLAA